jgi:hypothetical protein
MSYDVTFWKYEGPPGRDHVAVNAMLSRGEAVDGLEDLPIDDMIACLDKLLAGWERVGNSTWEKPGKWHLQTWTSRQHLTIHMSFGAARPVLLKIATPMRRFGCGLWNPQLGQRLAGYGEAGARKER